MNLKIRQYRDSLGLTQKQFAKEIKKSVGTVQSWEGGFSTPNAEAIWTICEFFGIDPNTLLGWYDEHPDDMAPAPVSRDEEALLDNYRACTPERRETLSGMARDQCALSRGEEAASPSSESIEAV